jgi:hypothetical protein
MNIVFILIILASLVLQEKPKQLEDLRWKNRLVLIFQNDLESKDVLSDSLLKEIKERKIIYFFIGEGVKSNAEIDFSSLYIEGLKNRYQLGEIKNSWVLIGLDGGIKMRKEEELDWRLIFKTIDSMPMRQSEIKYQK